MKSLLTEAAYTEITNRINTLSNETTPLWGKMDAAQMLHHCQFPLQIALQKDAPKLKPNFFAKIFFKKSLYNDKPWMKSLPAPKQFKVQSEKNFDEEKTTLLQLIEDFYQHKDEREWKYPHPVFGKFTVEQWGQMQYKHLDYHLNQFNTPSN